MESDRPFHSLRSAASRGMVLLTLAACPLLVGCVANSSSPTVAIARSRASDCEAEIELAIANGGGRDLVVTSLEYQLSHGEAGLPVADGVWQGALALDAGGSARLALRVPFAVEPLESDSRRLRLNGTLRFEDRTGYLGLGFMDLTTTSFQVEADADPLSSDPTQRTGPRAMGEARP
jgi:hypothetical protein